MSSLFLPFAKDLMRKFMAVLLQYLGLASESWGMKSRRLAIHVIFEKSVVLSLPSSLTETDFLFEIVY